MIMLKVAILNWWYEPDKKAKNWFIEYMKCNFVDVKEVRAGDPDTDVLIASVFGDVNKVKTCPARVKVFYSGESKLNKSYKSYNDQFLKENYDLILNFSNTNENEKVQRFPLWLLYVPKYNMDDEKDNFITYVLENRKKNMNNHKDKFACCIARHDPCNMRRNVCGELSKYGTITYPGRWKNNGGTGGKSTIGDKREDKINYAKHVKYMVCCESHREKGYCSEKIFEAFICGNIPVYWSEDMEPEREILKRDSYCLFEGEEIKNMVNNSKSYENSGVFTENAYNVLKREYYDKLKSNLTNLLRSRGKVMV